MSALACNRRKVGWKTGDKMYLEMIWMDNRRRHEFGHGCGHGFGHALDMNMVIWMDNR